jgi:hypothetical protein
MKSFEKFPQFLTLAPKSGTSIGNAWSVRESSGALSITWLSPVGVISAVVSVVAARGGSSTYCLPTVNLMDS